MNIRDFLKDAAVFVMVTLTLAGGIPAYAQGIGDLLVAPTRVVLEGAERTAELTLINIGQKPATYRISFIHQRMTLAGTFEPIDKPLPGEQFVDDIVRFTPRQVTLEPRVAQTVRMQLRKPADLQQGEYRSHLLFRAVDTEPGRQPDSGNKDGISIQIKPIYGVSIPVIVRQGRTSAGATLTDLKVIHPDVAGAPVILSVNINRTGNQSTYGDIFITYSRSGKESLQVGKVLGIAVYTPNSTRMMKIPLQLPAGVELKGGHLSVKYQQNEEDGGAGWADAVLDLE